MIELVADKPLLLLFLVSGVGYVLGKLKVAGFSLGISAVLFAGLAASAIDARLKLPEIIYELGLVLFVYTIAVASGPGFVSTLKRRGVRDNLLALSMIVFAFAMILIASVVTGISGERSSGLFAGALTNTPALAGVVEHLKQAGGGALAAEPVVAYSLAYPWGVIGPLLAIFITQRWWRVDYAKESSTREPILTRSVVVELEEPVSVASRRAAERQGGALQPDPPSRGADCGGARDDARARRPRERLGSERRGRARDLPPRARVLGVPARRPARPGLPPDVRLAAGGGRTNGWGIGPPASTRGDRHPGAPRGRGHAGPRRHRARVRGPGAGGGSARAPRRTLRVLRRLVPGPGGDRHPHLQCRHRPGAVAGVHPHPPAGRVFAGARARRGALDCGIDRGRGGPHGSIRVATALQHRHHPAPVRRGPVPGGDRNARRPTPSPPRSATGASTSSWWASASPL